jgi:hypothetical protein
MLGIGHQTRESDMTITANIIHAAKLGLVDLDAIKSREDVATAAKFSSHFNEAIRGLDGDLVWNSVQAAKAKGKRTFRRGCGLWLTDKEAAA